MSAYYLNRRTRFETEGPREAFANAVRRALSTVRIDPIDLRRHAA